MVKYIIIYNVNLNKSKKEYLSKIFNWEVIKLKKFLKFTNKCSKKNLSPKKTVKVEKKYVEI